MSAAESMSKPRRTRLTTTVTSASQQARIAGRRWRGWHPVELQDLDLGRRQLLGRSGEPDIEDPGLLPQEAAIRGELVIFTRFLIYRHTRESGPGCPLSQLKELAAPEIGSRSFDSLRMRPSLSTTSNYRSASHLVLSEVEGHRGFARIHFFHMLFRGQDETKGTSFNHDELSGP